MKGLLGTKIGMTQLFLEDGRAEAATAIQAGPCTVTRVKTKTKDGYDAIQVGYGEAKHINKPREGQLKGQGRFRYLREFRLKELGDLQVGATLDVDLFKPGDRVDIIGTSKGRGFAGVVKRHHFAGGPKTRGQSDRQRAPGAIGAGTTPGHILKGLRMAGHMGNDRVTVKNLEILSVDPERHILMVRGAVPGHPQGFLIVRKTRES